MTITRLLAQMTVTDSAAAKTWYGKLFGRGPDAEPMPGLLEWHLTDSFGVQVWPLQDPDGNRIVFTGPLNAQQVTR